MPLIEQLLEDPDISEDIEEAIVDDRFEFVEKNGKEIGWFCWKVVWSRLRKHIFINNMYIEPDFRNKTNLLFLRNYIREKFNKEYNFVFWHNTKKNRFYYCR